MLNKNTIFKRLFSLVLLLPIMMVLNLNVQAAQAQSALLDGISIDGVLLENFNSNTYNYVYEIDPEYIGTMDITVDKQTDNQIVINDGQVDLIKGNVSRYIFVVSEDGNNFQPYQIDFVRPNTSKLKDLYIEGFNFRNNVTFDPDVYEYDVDIFIDTPINVQYETFNDISTVTVTGDKNLTEGKNVVEINVSTSGTENKKYTINVYPKSAIDFGFTNNRQEFRAPADGLYSLELWGAQGGSVNDEYPGGLGDYVNGVVRLKKDEVLYLFTGGNGTSGYNGGGNSAFSVFGGGATDIRIGGETLNNRIIVAGGGGASSNSNKGGRAGVSGTGTGAGTAATQNAAGSRDGQFGLGGNTSEFFGGGGGFFGGGASFNANGSGGGGSSYIFTADSPKPSGYNPDSKYRMTHALYGDKTSPGKDGQGHIRITSYFDADEGSTDLQSIRINGQEIAGFNPNKTDYVIEIEGEHKESLKFEVDKKHINQTVTGNMDALLTHGDYTHRLNVQSADKVNNKTYTITFKRKPSNKLASLSVEGYNISPNFESSIQSYNVTIGSSVGFKVNATAFDDNAKVTIKGDKPENIGVGSNIVSVTVSRDGVSDFTYNIVVHVKATTDFTYTGNIQKFDVSPGSYMLEVWGAQGGNSTTRPGGKGGYSKGQIDIKDTTTLYIGVGGQGVPVPQPGSGTGGFNGGGNVSIRPSNTGGGAGTGGGATHIAMRDGLLSGLENFKSSVLIVGGAGGGAESCHMNASAAGGGLSGTPGVSKGWGTATAGTQTSGGRLSRSHSTSSGSTNGSFGKGGNSSGGGQGPQTCWYGGGGGGGWYGGGPSTVAGPGAGGSGYIAGTTEGSTHGGTTVFESPNGSTGTGHTGNGHARITLLVPAIPSDKTLSHLEILSDGTSIPLLQDFQPERDEYDVVLDSEQHQIVIKATPNDHRSLIAGDIDILLTIPSGDSQYTFTVTGEDGSIKTYYINVHRTPSSYPYLDDLTIGGETIEGFIPDVLEYRIDLPYDASRKAFLGWTIARPDQEVIGDDIVDMVKGEPIVIRVWAEDKINFSDYKIIPNFEDTNLLKELNIEEIGIPFVSETFEYDIHIPLSVSYLTMDPIPYDDDATVVINGGGYLRPGTNVITITVKHPRLPDQVYTLNVTRSESAEDLGGVEYDYVYTGDIQYFIVPYTGDFKVEAWGAQGGDRGGSEGGRGGYSNGTVYLVKDDVLAVYVGGTGNNISRGYNGGGLSATTGVYGGGASDVRIKENNYNLYDRIVVAGGGGSVGARTKPGAAGGGINGINATQSFGSGGTGGTQTAPGLRGTFGKGGNGLLQNNGRGGAGGGGFYGGGGVTPDRSVDDDRGGGGGSAYILTENSHKPNGYYAGEDYFFFDTEMIPGNKVMPNKAGGFTTGNIGHGFVRITGLRRESNDNYLDRIDLEPEGLTLEPVFDSLTNIDQTEFDLYLDSETAEIKITGVPMDPRATVEGNDTYLVESGTNTIELIVTAENGDVRTYTITTHREKSSNGLPIDIKITGLVPSLCNLSDEYCKLDPLFDVQLSPDGGYRMIVPARIEEIEFTTIKGHPFQTVVGDGVIKLETNVDNIHEVTVTSEDGSKTSTYKFVIIRDMSSNADLGTLDILDPDIELNFNKDITEYYASFPNEYDHMNKLNIEFSPYDEFASAEIMTDGELELGLNEIEIMVTSSNGKIRKIYRIFAYRELSENTFLSELRVYPNDGATDIMLTPHFDKIIDQYFLVVGNEVDRVRIEADVENEHTTLDIIEDGLYPLEVGSNTIILETMAQDNETSTEYIITIVRRPSTNTNLESVLLNAQGVGGFNKHKPSQTIIVDSGYVHPRITAITEDAQAKVAISGAINGFAVGDNVVYFKVTAESGTEKTYTVNFHRPASANTYLKSFNASLFTVDFDKEVREYHVAIPYTETPLTLVGVTEHSTSILKGAGQYTLVPGENHISLEITAENGDVGMYDFYVTMMKNNDARLKELKLNTGTLIPGFSPDIYEYEVDIPEGLPEIIIDGVPIVSSTEVEGNTKHELFVGDNVIKITTKADSGARKTYTLNIHRTKSTDATLDNIVVKQGSLSPDFDSNTYEYTVLVPNGTRRLDVVPTLSNMKATAMVLGSDGLILGENLVYVRVTAEDKDHVKDYVLKVIVQDPPSENTDLEYLRVDKGTLVPVFTPHVKYYVVDVANEIEEITVDAKAMEGEIISGPGLHQLEVGQNMITVSIEAENGVINDYQIEVNRLLSTNTKLETLDILNIERMINFNPNVTEYSVDTFDNALNIKATTQHPGATYEIIDNQDFVTGETKTVTIRVTSEDGAHHQDYLINAHKLKSVNNYLSHLEVLGYELTPNFNSTQTTYKLNVRHEINQVLIEALVQDPNATVSFDSNVTLEVGRNFVDIIVTAENGSIKTYTIEITRDGSYIRDLESISVNQEPLLNFDKVLTEYELEFDYEVDSVYVDYVKSDEKSFVFGGGQTHLSVGVNTVNLIVTSESGDTKTYIVRITRKPMNSAKLKTLEVGKYLFEQTFDKDQLNYNLFVNNEIEELELTIVTEDPNAKYTVEGNKKFKVGTNEVTITVESSSRDKVEVYTLTVVRYAYANNFLLDLVPSEGELTPEFDQYNHVYDIEVDQDTESIIFTGLKENGTTVTGLDQEHDLEMGINHIKIQVISNTGIFRTYHIFVNRSFDNSNDLLALEVTANGVAYELGEPFDKDTLEYTLKESIVAGTERVHIRTTTNGQTVEGNGNVQIVAGDNTHYITVTSESGLEKTYTLHMYREKSTNNALTNIVPSAGTLNPYFIYSGTEYEIRLDSSVTTLGFNVSLEDKNAIVTGHERTIVEEGTSIRTITVTSESNDVREYRIVIVKGDTNNALLEHLNIVGHGLGRTFDSNVFEYNVTVPHNKLTLSPHEIEAIAKDKNSRIYKSSTIDLNTTTPTTFEVEVRAVDGFTRETYRLNVIREKGNDASISQIEFGEYGRLDRVFRKNEFYYELEFTHEVSHFDPTVISNLVTTDANATVTYSTTDPIEIAEGRFDRFTITVVSEDKSDTKEYHFDITYRRSTDSKLSSLRIDEAELTPGFSPDTLEYSVSIDENRTDLPIHATTRDEKAVIISDIEGIEINKPETVIEIVVQSEKGNQTTYKLTIKRDLSRRVDLEDLSLTDAGGAKLNPNFDNYYDTFTSNVARANEVIGVIAKKGHPSQTITLYDKFNNVLDMNAVELDIGENELRVEVQTPFEEKRDIKLLVTRVGNSNNNLESLEILKPKTEDTEIDFRSGTLEYHVEVNNETNELELKYTTEVESSTVEVIGNHNFRPGLNDVIVRVTNEMGHNKEYIIHVFKGAAFNNYLETITVSDKGEILSDKDRFSPIFSKYYTDYKASVDSTRDSVTVDAVPEEGFEKVEVTFTSEISEIVGETATGIEVKLNPGSNIIKIHSKHIATGEIRIYTVDITREKFSGIELKDLQVHKGNDQLIFEEGNFTPGQNVYSLNVTPDTQSLIVTPTLVNEGANARVEVFGNNYLVDGVNIIRVVITSEDRTKMAVYTILVTKEQSNVNTLDKLSAQETGKAPHNFDLSQDELRYEVGKDVDSILIAATSTDPLATVSNLGVHALNYGPNEIVVSVTAQNGAVRSYTVVIVRAYDNTLKNITLTQGMLTPEFNPNTFQYTVEVPEEVFELGIFAEANNPNATVEGTGFRNLEMGANNFTITVRSNETSFKDTNITVIRKPSENADLKLLNIEEGALTPRFDKAITKYTSYIKKTHDTIHLDVLVDNPLATYEISAISDGQVAISGEKVTITGFTQETITLVVKVTAASGSTKEYTLTIYRQDEALFSDKLSTLVVKSNTPTVEVLTMTPTFDPNITNYMVAVNKDVTSINISGTRVSDDAEIQTGFGNHDVNPGMNIYNVSVLSKDGIENTYQIVIHQAESSDSRLDNIHFQEGNISPVFESDRTQYKMNVASNVQYLTNYTITPKVQGTTWTIEGHTDLKYGDNEVKITTRSADQLGSMTYTIIVNRDDNVSLYLDDLSSNVGMFTEEFKKDRLNYVLEVSGNTNSVILSATAEEPDAIDSISNTNQVISLAGVDEKRVEVKVTGKNGKTLTYLVDIRKNYDENSYLTYLWVNPGTLNPEFTEDRFSYTVEVETDVERIEIKANTDIDAEIIGLGTKNLNFGENTFTVSIMTNDGTILNTYTIKVTRTAVTSSKILELEFEEIHLQGFDKDTLSYSVDVPYGIEELTLRKIVLEDPDNSEYTITQTPSIFEQGMGNIIEITVTNVVTQEETVYTIRVNLLPNVSNRLTSLRVYNFDKSEEFTLEPTFNSNTLAYEVRVPYEINQVYVDGQLESANAGMQGGSGILDLNVGENVHVIKAFNGGINREYVLRIYRAEDSNNFLESLSISNGTLTPAFDKETYDYTINVGASVDEIEFEGVAESERAEVIGNMKVAITQKDTIHNMIVVAQDGSSRTYRIKVIKSVSDEVGVVNITPTNENVSLEFDPDTYDYNISVSDDIYNLGFIVETTDENAVVTGHSPKDLEYGENQFEITVTSQDGNHDVTYTITVTRDKLVRSLTLNPDNLVLEPGDVYSDLELIVDPFDATNQEVTYTSSDEDIITVDENGVITAIAPGSTEIIVTLDSDPSINARIIVEVMLLRIEINPDVESRLEINRDKLLTELPYSNGEYEISGFVIGSYPGTRVETYKSMFLNKASTLKIYDKDNNIITDNTKFIGTHMVVRLEINEIVYDELMIFVRGDGNGDGEVNIVDISLVGDFINSGSDESNPNYFTNILTNISLDVNGDGQANVVDISVISDYINRPEDNDLNEKRENDE